MDHANCVSLYGPITPVAVVGAEVPALKVMLALCTCVSALNFVIFPVIVPAEDVPVRVPSAAISKVVF